jgi:hypothetical protein
MIPKLLIVVLLPVVSISSIGRGARQAQASRNVIEHIDAVVHAAESLLTRTHSENRHIRQTVHALAGIGWKCAVDNEATPRIIRVDEEVILGEAADVDSRKLNLSVSN